MNNDPQSDPFDLAVRSGSVQLSTDPHVGWVMTCTDVRGTAAWQPVSGTSVSSVEGTVNQVLVNGTSGTPQLGDIVLTLPQDISATSSPSFAGITITSLSSTGIPYVSTGGGIGSLVTIGSNLVLNTSTLSVSLTPTFTNITTGLTKLVGTGSVTLSLPTSVGTSGYVLTSAGAGSPMVWSDPSLLTGVSSITGTSDQILANGSATVPQSGSVILTLPQSISTGSSPTFVGMTLTGVTASNILYLGASNNITSLSIGPNLTLIGGTLDTIQNLTTSSSPVFSSIRLSLGASVGRILRSDSSGNATWVAPSSFAVTALTGTANQVIASASIGSVILSLPQDIATTSTPTFQTVAISGITNPSLVYVGASNMLTGVTLTANLTLTSGTLDTAQAIRTTSTPTFAAIRLTTGAATDYILRSDSSGNATWVALSSLGVTSITGTTNQVIASASTGSVTLSLPQSIATASSPTFAGLTVSGTTASTLIYSNASKALASVTLGSNLTLTTGTLDTIQAIGTGSSPTFNGLSLTGTMNMSGLTASQVVVTNGSKNFASYPYSSANTASSIVSRNSVSYAYASSFVSLATSNTATGTVTLTSLSTRTQIFSGGTGSATVVLPDATSMQSSIVFEIINNASGSITVNTSDSATLVTAVPGSHLLILLISNATSVGTWDYRWLVPKDNQFGSSGLRLYGSLTTSNGSTYNIGASGTAFATGYFDNINISTSTALTLTYFNGSKNLASASLGSNLTLISGTLDTIQAIGTDSSPTFAGLTVSGLTASQVVITDGAKSLASIAYSATGGTSNIVSRDANGNSYANNWLSGATSTVTSGQSVNLNPNATRKQIATGTSTITYKLPNAQQLTVGATYEFNNNSTGLVTINDSQNNAITTILPGAFKLIYCVTNATAAGTWDYHTLPPDGNTSWGTDGLTVDGYIIPYFSGSYNLGASSALWNTVYANSIRLVTGATNGYVLRSNASGDGSWVALSGIAVTSITGTTNQVNASASTGAITLSLPQSIATSSSPTFAGLSISGTITSGTWNGSVISGTYGGTGVNNGSSTITLGGSLSFIGAFTTSLTVGATTALTLPASGTVLSTTNSSGNYVSSITGTANQVTASASTGAITLSLPQSIATSSDVQFNKVSIGAVGTGKFDIQGSQTSSGSIYGALIRPSATMTGNGTTYCQLFLGGTTTINGSGLNSVELMQISPICTATTTCNNLMGIHIYPSSGSGTINTSWGLFVENPGVGTNKYAAYLGGKTLVGTNTDDGSNSNFMVANSFSIGANANTTASTGLLRLQSTGSVNYIQSGLAASGGSAAPLVFTAFTAANEWMRITSTGSVGIGTSSPDASAILDLTTTTKGFKPPSMTTTQRNAISSPAAGLIVNDTTNNCLYSYGSSSGWLPIVNSNTTGAITWTGAANSLVKNAFFARSGNVVTFTMSQINGSSVSSTTIDAAAGSVPSFYRIPVDGALSTFYFPVFTSRNGTNAAGILVMNSDGSMSIRYKDGDTAFTNTQSFIVFGFSISYTCTATS